MSRQEELRRQSHQFSVSVVATVLLGYGVIIAEELLLGVIAASLVVGVYFLYTLLRTLRQIQNILSDLNTDSRSTGEL